jgi:hypothetical protein
MEEFIRQSVRNTVDRYLRLMEQSGMRPAAHPGDFYEFTPEIPAVGKMLLLTEEMHRLHVNEWKNFPWNAFMYENV